MTILDEIVQSKRNEVDEAKRRTDEGELRLAIATQDPPRDFYQAVTQALAHDLNLIAEVKKASPSAGVLVQDFDPVAIARTYEQHGASAVSVLTDASYFGGALGHLAQIKENVSLPVLRKDFLVDPFQVLESRAAGADAVLLIVEALTVSGVVDLMAVARPLDMTCLIEVHAEESLRSLLEHLGPPGPANYLLGINNRDLHKQRTDLATTDRLAAMLPTGTPFVSESGLASRSDVLRVRQAGACAILVGESLLRSGDIGQQIRQLLEG
jgi:indole-3-glycerol phosphate synthase